MFRFTQEPSSERYNQCLAKITSLVQQCVLMQTLSVLWRHFLPWCANRYCVFAQWTIHTHTRSQCAAVTLTKSVPTHTVEQDL